MQAPIHPKSIVILDFGGQYAHLIARRVRQYGAYSEILDAETPAKALKDAAGIILSGGPQSVYDPESPQGDPGIFELGIPVLGICYGLHWMTQALGGEVIAGKVKEYGHTPIRIVDGGGTLLQDCGDECVVWMSHGDEASTLPEGFSQTATSDACANAAFADEARKFFAVQFHPEVTHTEHGEDILKRFVETCDAAPWSIESYAKHIGDQILKEVGDRKVFMLVSGGVDSTVAFTLLNEVLGSDRVQGLLVDTGLMRKNEVNYIKDAFDRLGITNLRIEDASDEFLANLDGVYEPEKKRKIIGDTFLAVQQRVCDDLGLEMAEGWSANRSAAERSQKSPSTRSARSGQPPLRGGWILGQGTIYPDTIETGGTRHADQIKTHHNRVEAVQKMIDAGLVIEPLNELYKDEVRTLGEELGLPHELVWRHPFPGPGLGVRILCAKEEVWPKKWQTDAERILGNVLKAIGDLEAPYQVRVLPVQSVGVQGDARTYRHAVAVFTEADIPQEAVAAVANRVPEINRVLTCVFHGTPVDFIFTPGAITTERADLLREADAIVDEEMRKADQYNSVWQFPVVLLPIGTEEGGQAIVLRPVESQEAMTANAARLPEELLLRLTKRILGISGIDLVFLDLTNKPPGTIEWE